HRLAHRYAEGRWVAVGGGGYQIASVVPRAWTVYFAELSGQEVPHEVPWEWLSHAEELSGLRPPSTFLDGPVPLNEERAVETRRMARDSVEQLKRHAFDLLGRH